MNEEKCWLCLRTTPQKILEGCHKLYTDTEVAHTIGTKVAELLRDLYFKKPGRVSGRHTNGLIGGAVYIVSIMEGLFTRQQDIASVYEIHPVTIRNNYRYLLKILEINEEEFLKKRNSVVAKNVPTWAGRKRSYRREKSKPKKEKPKPTLKNPWNNVPGVVSTARGIHTVEARTEPGGKRSDCDR